MTASVWMASPPEVHSALLSSGPGPGALVAAAHAWSSLSAEYTAVADELAAVVGAVHASDWAGPGSDAYAAAHVPYLAWLLQAAADSAAAAAQHETTAAAYTAALSTMPTLPELAANHMVHGVLVATNFFGINTIPITLNEVDYVRMWVQAAATMSGYQAMSTAAVVAIRQTPPAPQVVKSDVTPHPLAGSDNPLTQLGQLIQQLIDQPDPFGLDHLMSQLGLGKFFSEIEQFEGANNVFNLILPYNPFTPLPPGTTLQEELSNIWLSFTQGTFVFDPKILTLAHNPSQLISELILFATQLVTHRITDLAQLLFNFPQLLAPAASVSAAPAAGLSGVAGIAGIGTPAPAVPAETAPPPVAASEPQPLIGVAPALAPAPPPAALAAPPTPPPTPPPPPPPPPPPLVAGAEALSFPYLVGGPGIGSGSGMSTAAGETVRKRVSRPVTATSSAGAATDQRRRRAPPRRRRMRGYDDEHMEMNIEVEPDWETPEPREKTSASPPASSRHTGVLGFAGTAGRSDGATGLITLPGDTFGGVATVPMMPAGWDVDSGPTTGETGADH